MGGPGSGRKKGVGVARKKMTPEQVAFHRKQNRQAAAGRKKIDKLMQERKYGSYIPRTRKNNFGADWK